MLLHEFLVASCVNDLRVMRPFGLWRSRRRKANRPNRPKNQYRNSDPISHIIPFLPILL